MGRYRTSQYDYNEVEAGVAVILYDEDTRIAEVFRCDRDHTVRLRTFRKRIPKKAMYQLLTRSKLVLNPFLDGTPLEKGRLPAVMRNLR